MKIAVIGSGNIGGALAAGWARAGHSLRFGVRDPQKFKGRDAAESLGIEALPIVTASSDAEVIVLAGPGGQAVEIARSLPPLQGQIVIDAMNAMSPPAGFNSVAAAVAGSVQGAARVVKCFNTTGWENIADPRYGDQACDMFMAGDDVLAKGVVAELAAQLGFGACHDFGGADRFALLEQLAFCWINLAMGQKQGRAIAFKLLRR